jgi:hypothetical protein
MRGLVRIMVAAAAVAVTLLARAAGQAGGPPSLAWSPSTSGSFDYVAVGVGHNASKKVVGSSPIIRS